MIASYVTRKDIDKYYRGTYVKIPETGQKILFLVESVDSAGITLKGTNGEKGYISFYEEGSYSLENPLPNKAFWAESGDFQAKFVSRIPARMWKKGIHPENVAIYRPSADALHLSRQSIEPIKNNNLFFCAPIEERVCKNGNIFDGVWFLSNKGPLYYKNILCGFNNGAALFLFKGLQDKLNLPNKLKQLRMIFV